MGEQENQIPNFQLLKNDLSQNGTLFEDPWFPLNNSLFSFQPKQIGFGSIKWKRPWEISKTPRFFEDKSSFTLKPGKLSTECFAAVICCIIHNDSMFHRIISCDQEFGDETYAGIFKFQFWNFGKWEEVFVDDRIPVNGNNIKEILSLTCKKPNVFWLPLLEKAYAKWLGSYARIEKRSSAEIFSDLTGGFVISLNPKLSKNEIYEYIEASKYPVFIIAKSTADYECKDLQGILPNAIYSVTKLIKNPFKNFPPKKTRWLMLRMKHSFREITKWAGPWNQKSAEWSILNHEKRAKIGLKIHCDGEFWIEFHDFIKVFREIVVCYLNNFISDNKAKPSCGLTVFEGSWSTKSSVNCINPRFIFSLIPNKNEKNCKLFVQQLLKENCNQMQRENEDNKNYSPLKLYKIEMELNNFVLKPISLPQSIVMDGQLSLIANLSEGAWMIQPWMPNSNDCGVFMIRMASNFQIVKSDYVLHGDHKLHYHPRKNIKSRK